MERELKENELIVSPSGKFGYQITPLTDIKIVVTREELKAIDNRVKCFDLETMKVVDYDNTEDELIKDKEEKIRKLKMLLYQTDYKAIKFAEGELSYSDYEETRLLRKSYRDEINKLEQEIRELKQ